MSLLVDSAHVDSSDDEGGGGGGHKADDWKSVTEKIHPAYTVDVKTKYIGKVIRSSKARHNWLFVFPEDAVDRSVPLPVEERATRIDVVHSTMSGRIEVLVNGQLSASNMLKHTDDTVWKLAKPDAFSPIVFDAQAKFKGHTIRVTIKTASEKQFKVCVFVCVCVVWCVCVCGVRMRVRACVRACRCARVRVRTRRGRYFVRQAGRSPPRHAPVCVRRRGTAALVGVVEGGCVPVLHSRECCMASP
jgi:hypothetical protein